MTFELALHVSGLAPRRGGRAVAEGVSFALPPGGGLCLRGANGSGKTSVLRAVAGLCEADGAVAFSRAGEAVEAAEARARHVHLLAPGEGLSARLSVAETLRYWNGLHGEGSLAVLGRVGLSGREDEAVGALSTGQRRRLGLARLLAAPRAVWLLDEPMSGLDADGRAVLLAEIAGHRAAGGLVLMATHEDGLTSAPVLRLS